MSLYTACAFDVTVQNRTDMFCKLFDPQDIEVFEVQGDLEDFYTKVTMAT